MSMPTELLAYELKQNKHNKNTATYHLLLKGYLRKLNRSLIDYYQMKQLQSQNMLRLEEEKARTNKIRRKMQRDFSQPRGSLDLPSLKDSRERATRSNRK